MKIRLSKNRIKQVASITIALQLAYPVPSFAIFSLKKLDPFSHPQETKPATPPAADPGASEVSTTQFNKPKGVIGWIQDKIREHQEVKDRREQERQEEIERWQAAEAVRQAEAAEAERVRQEAIAKARAEQEAREKEYLKDMKSALAEESGRNEMLNTAVRDVVVTDMIKAIQTPSFGSSRNQVLSIAVAIGNPSHSVDAKTLEQTTQIVKEAASQKIVVIYDADSASAKEIQEAAGAYGIGVTGNPKKENLLAGIYWISNPFYRTAIFGGSDHFFTSPDSVVGMAMNLDYSGTRSFFRKEAQAHMVDPSRSWKNGLMNWQKALPEIRGKTPAPKSQEASQVSEVVTAKPPVPKSLTEVKLENLGIQFQAKNSPSILDSANQLFNNQPSTKRPPSRPSDQEIVERLTYRQAQKAVHYVEILSKKIKVLENQERGLGIAVIGSGSSSSYDVVTSEIIATFAQVSAFVSHGGAEGAMAVAAQTSKREGVPNIGITLGGQARLTVNETAQSQWHDVSLSGNGYETRIPAIFYRTFAILGVPGGRGTIQEMVVHFIDEAVTPQSHRWMVLVGKNYYGPLYDLIQKSSFPESFKKNVKLIDSQQEAEELVQQTFSSTR